MVTTHHHTPAPDGHHPRTEPAAATASRNRAQHGRAAALRGRTGAQRRRPRHRALPEAAEAGRAASGQSPHTGERGRVGSGAKAGDSLAVATPHRGPARTGETGHRR
ncbi:hypothetical protein GCM10010502_73940 [Kitasatospora aureofaciens]|uniref:Uncharacterized protein n=1 Tax=Kitasatospora aureofaciens TaxID=1894 RepID=A0A8H9I139_KITAU|nr:hypothetical protein GCM10010502_73940 [Kitasatospora aureofaciens]